MDSFAHERTEHATAQRLAAALDEVDIGIVLLDADTRAEFINRAFRFYFGLPDAKADSKPAFVALMYHGRDTGAFELPAEELNAFIARRMEMMRIGDSTPINIRLNDGTVLRFSCKALPGGGRMLSYTPVTDLVRNADRPADADYLRVLRNGGDRMLARLLRAAEQFLPRGSVPGDQTLICPVEAVAMTRKRLLVGEGTSMHRALDLQQ
jgi:PAS domain-containing protein